ncbi:MAG: glycosyltransferase family A protein [Lachnospiraceae bacterium]|nr:glycosyltransferase family A protein [Lachnospiraceae bacterium]
MKILSIAIPSYNSQEYMRHSIESLLPGGDDVEILVIDDGSKDDTLKIAQEYERRYPGIVRAIHQENKGHGGAVNTGIENASGEYFKVVDSDDWVDEEAYGQILSFLKKSIADGEGLDMLLSNYVYEKQGALHKKVISYNSVLPENQYFGWEDIGKFKVSQNILMHSVIYRTQLLKDCGFKLPEHTFYVDNLFVYYPLPYVKKMYYLSVDFYRYFIGRDDQSVNEKVMISRIDQQIRVTKLMIDTYAEHEDHFSCKNLKNYMLHYLKTIMMVTSVLLVRKASAEKSDEATQMRNDVWGYLKKTTPEGYKSIKKTAMGHLSDPSGKLRAKITVGGYKIAQKWFGFN